MASSSLPDDFGHPKRRHDFVLAFLGGLVALPFILSIVGIPIGILILHFACRPLQRHIRLEAEAECLREQKSGTHRRETSIQVIASLN